MSHHQIVLPEVPSVAPDVGHPPSQLSDAAPKATPFDDVQGDVLIGLQKRVEAFVFLAIDHPADFRNTLKTKLASEISTTVDVEKASRKVNAARLQYGRIWIPLDLVNIGFTAPGLAKLGIDVATDFSGDVAFQAGQEKDALGPLADPQVNGQLSTWKTPYLGRKIDIVLVVTSPKQQDLDCKVHDLLQLLGKSVSLVFRVDGIVRPGAEEGHEHFGYLRRPSGEAKIDASVILTGQDASQPKTWTHNGSFMAFRELQQLVPEFDDFVNQTSLAFQLTNPAITPDLIGARVVGRWKSGAPVVVTPGKDDQTLAKDQNFDYANDLLQEACPYVAHIRKTDPRLGTGIPNFPIDPHLILREGIPYGPEVTPEERAQNTTLHERGLLFACYQSVLENGFQFLQSAWANNAQFPPNKANINNVGQDLIIGQAEGSRFAQGIKPDSVKDPNANVDPNNLTNAPSQFVVPRGGEYFFMPSVSALKTKLGA